MKIVVVSDNHGDRAILEQIYLDNLDATYFYHLGDSCLPKEYLSHYLCVKGNNDYIDLPKEIDIQYSFGTVHLEHGDRIDYFNFEKYVASKNCDFFFFGHRHRKLYKKIGNTHVFNPGSTNLPRDDRYGSYLILNIEDNKLESYEFIKIKLNFFNDI